MNHMATEAVDQDVRSLTTQKEFYDFLCSHGGALSEAGSYSVHTEIDFQTSQVVKACYRRGLLDLGNGQFYDRVSFSGDMPYMIRFRTSTFFENLQFASSQWIKPIMCDQLYVKGRCDLDTLKAKIFCFGEACYEDMFSLGNANIFALHYGKPKFLGGISANNPKILSVYE